ncbi:hypothetical protein GCM10023322_38480 [Rugosimonospora acidiphila]|uniref:Rho termination factor N-terminal domain-containing protein n=1 Tax=Rugosimonospora acidiphila TaxID=556531 RepID=A0ABP9RVY9_9ACTN
MTTDPADLTHLVLLKVAEFIRRLPADQLADLAEGSAKLELVPKGGRVAARGAGTSRATAAPTVSVQRVREYLSGIGDRASGIRYVDELKLTVAQLRALAKELGIAVPSKAAKAQVTSTIVEWTVGHRLDSESISRPAPARG